MPPEVEKKAVTLGNAMPFMAQIILASVLWLLIRHSGFRFATFGLILDGWEKALFWGGLAGLGWLGIYVLLMLLFRPSKEILARHMLLQCSAAFWIPLSLTSAVVEEVWRGFCLVSLAGHGAVEAVAVTAIACGLAHAKPRGRAVSATAFALYAAWLFLSTHSLLATVPAHAIVNIGTLYLIRLSHSQPGGSPFSPSS
jgi:Type II CAAX prenyl endopeptidase Rce1-like